MTSSGKRPDPRNFPPELRERAVKMVFEVRRQTGERQGSMSRVAGELGIGAETLRNWVRRTEIDSGERPGTSSEDVQRIAELEGGELGAAPGERHLEGGSGLLRGGARPPVSQVVAFIDAHRDNRTGGRRWGIEPICEQLQVAPSTYWSAKSRPLSRRALRDAELGPLLVALFVANYSVYGRRKLHKAAGLGPLGVRDAGR